MCHVTCLLLFKSILFCNLVFRILIPLSKIIKNTAIPISNEFFYSSDSEAISLDEFHTFSQMCYDVQKSASNTDIPCTRYFQAAVTKSPVRDPRKKLNNDDSQKVENQKLETIEQLTRKPRVGQPLVLRPPQRRFGGMGRDKVADTPSRCLLQPSPNTDDKFLSAYRARLQVTTKFNESSKGGSSKVAILESEQTNKRGKQRTSEMNTSGKGHRTGKFATSVKCYINLIRHAS